MPSSFTISPEAACRQASPSLNSLFYRLFVSGGLRQHVSFNLLPPYLLARFLLLLFLCCLRLYHGHFDTVQQVIVATKMSISHMLVSIQPSLGVEGSVKIFLLHWSQVPSSAPIGVSFLGCLARKICLQVKQHQSADGEAKIMMWTMKGELIWGMPAKWEFVVAMGRQTIPLDSATRHETGIYKDTEWFIHPFKCGRVTLLPWT